MKKILLLLIPLLFLNCSSEESNNNSQESPNYIEVNNQKYFFDKAVVYKGADIDRPSFGISLSNKTTNDKLEFQISVAKSNSTSSADFHLIATTYKYNISSPAIDAVIMSKYNPATKTFNVLFNNADFTGIPKSNSRIIVTKNSDTNYTFDISFVTTQGLVKGSYTGEITKANF